MIYQLQAPGLNKLRQSYLGVHTPLHDIDFGLFPLWNLLKVHSRIPTF